MAWPCCHLAPSPWLIAVLQTAPNSLPIWGEVAIIYAFWGEQSLFLSSLSTENFRCGLPGDAEGTGHVRVGRTLHVAVWVRDSHMVKEAGMG